MPECMATSDELAEVFGGAGRYAWTDELAAGTVFVPLGYDRRTCRCVILSRREKRALGLRPPSRAWCVRMDVRPPTLHDVAGFECHAMRDPAAKAKARSCLSALMRANALRWRKRDA